MENIRKKLQEDKIDYSNKFTFTSSVFEAVKLMPDNTDKLLDVGCGSGIARFVSKKLQKNINQYHGIEFNDKAINTAKVNLDFFYYNDIETIETNFFPENTFDVIMFNDVIEHLVYPEITLKKFLKFLKPDGSLIMSIPNVRHQSVLLNLILNGRWTDGGVSVKEHLSFFTLVEIVEMLDSLSFGITENIALTTNTDPAMRAIIKAARPWLKDDYKQSLNEVEVFQYVFRAAKIKENIRTDKLKIKTEYKPNIVYEW